ncbi:MAG: YggS family pyridoxal phosphate-dependent enzyme [Pseudomonadota bacterium]
MAVGDETAVARLATVKQAIVRAEEAAVRRGGPAILVAVSKVFPAEVIDPVIVAGQRVFGENRVQEAQGKWPALKDTHPDIELHLIGPLQSNKAADAVALFDVIQTVDRPKIARVLAQEMKEQGRSLSLFVQVNTGEEPQKAGVSPGDAVSFVAMCRDELSLNIVGLMCIPPIDEEAAIHFALLDKLANECGVEGRSMGMSGDFETAISFGATHVRVGSAIFGARPTKNGADG